MKHLILILGLAVAFTACKNSEKEKNPTLVTNQNIAVNNQPVNNALSDSANYTTVEWSQTNKDLGKVKKGQTVEIPYTVKNTGDKPLIIVSVIPGCGCTVAEKPEKPIMPGKEEKIVAKFNSENQAVGTHSKTITVSANTKPATDHMLTFKVEVVE